MRVNDFALPVIHERRRFTDMMDEEIDDEATQGPVLPDHRMSISYNAATGVSILKLDPAHLYDCGVYKAVARNKVGQTVAKARLVVGDIPMAPDSPEATDVSDTEILLRWKVPRQDGNSPVLCYSLQQKEASANDWTDLAENIDHEFFLVRNLVANTDYQFRLAARNKFGWSDKSIPTQPVPTKDVGSPRVSVTRAMKYLQQLTESGQQLFLSDAGQADSASTASTDYTVETDPKHVKCTPPTDDLSFIAEINRGRFSLIAKCADKESNKMFAAKIVKKDDESLEEMNILRTLCHERIVSLHQGYESGDLLVSVLEKLQGVDVLTCLSQRHEYTENMVATIISQVSRFNICRVVFSLKKLELRTAGAGRTAISSLERTLPFGPPAGQRAPHVGSQH